MSFLTKDIELAVDLGTKNIVIMHNGNIIIDDEAVIAVKNGAKPVLLGIGEQVRRTCWRGGFDMRIVRPFEKGRIEDEYLFRLMFDAFLAKAVYLARPRWQRFFIVLREAFKEAPVLWLYLAIFLVVILIICL